VLQKPGKSGSTYYNYKHTCSIVLMALVDAKGKFIYVDVGAPGRLSDGGVYNNWNLSQQLENDALGIPNAEILPLTDIMCPYMIVADEAFPLRLYIMKPYHRRGLQDRELIFNYRLSRARRVVENAFGVMANRFRIYRAPIIVHPQTAKKIVLATTVLHNYLSHRKNATRIDPDSSLNQINDDYFDDDLQGESTSSNALIALQAGSSGRQMSEAKVLRDKLADYFVGQGKVAWQDRALSHCHKVI